MGKETSVFAYIKNIYRLIDHVKQQNIKVIASYGNDTIFYKIYQRMKYNIEMTTKIGPDGQNYNYYRLEL